jgi:hypothetical protein
MPRSATVALVCLLVCGCRGGDAGEAMAETEPEPVAVVGGTPAQRGLLRAIVRRAGTRTIERVTIAPARPLWKPFPRGSVGVVFSSHERSVRARWEVRLVAGAFGDRAHERGLKPVIAYESDFGASRIGPRRRGVGRRCRVRATLPARSSSPA